MNHLINKIAKIVGPARDRVAEQAGRLWTGFHDCARSIVSDFRDTFYSAYDAGYTVAYLLPILLALLIGLAPSIAFGDDRLILHGLSDHSTGNQFVERNWGVGVELDAGRQSTCTDYVTGAYRNSHGNPSVYGLCSWDVGRAGRLSAHVQAGAVLGYTSVDKSIGSLGVLPLVGLNGRADLPGPVDGDLFVAPLVDETEDGDDTLGYVALLSASLPF